MAKSGKLFVLEGPDGVGKTTLSKALAEHIASSGHACEYISFPGHEEGSIGNLVYRLHHEPLALGVTRISPQTLQLLHIASHLDAIEFQILPALEAGRHVVLDRFWWSTYVYGVVSGIPKSSLRRMISVELEAWGNLKPTILLLVDRNSPLREEPSFWPRLRAEYKQLASEESLGYPIREVINEGDLTTVRHSIELLVGSSLLQVPNKRDDAKKSQQGTLDLVLSSAAPRASSPTVFSKLSPAKPTVVFDTYWHFASKRQEIFHRRVAGSPLPWTDDPILREHKFTNAYRASDRVSQYLISKVIYDGSWGHEDLFFRIILFKLFNRIETWEMLRREVGEIQYSSYDYRLYDSVLTRAVEAKTRIYSAAYIMPTGRGELSFDRKHRTHLKLLEGMMRDGLPERIASAKSMQQAFSLLRAYPTVGDFLAYQYVTDLNYSTLTNFTEMEFVIPGPGARDGIKKCFSDMGGLSEADLIRAVTDRQVDEFKRLGIQFRSLWGRDLQLIDCQNLFCEVDKYARLRHPEFKGHTERTRIKQKYRYLNKPLVVWYPPKWGLNDKLRGLGHAKDVPGNVG